MTTGPRSSIANRVLASFAVTVVAFTVTMGWSVYSQRRAAFDQEELTKGYVPARLKVGQLKATQATLAALVDGIPDERDPPSARRIFETLVAGRRAQIEDTRTALDQGLRDVGGPTTRTLSTRLVAELDATADGLEEDRRAFEQLFVVLASGDKDQVNAVLVPLGALEHDADRRLRTLGDELASSMEAVSGSARERLTRSIYALAILAALTLGVGVAVSIHTRRLLSPLGRVTERARAVARGDLTPQKPEGTGDEIGHLSAAFEGMVAAVAQAQDRALSNERLAAIGKMAAHVTHEIRNPLSSIGLNLELLDEEVGREDRREEARSLLRSVAREVERLEHLSEEYLRVARLPSPRMEADDLAAALGEIVGFARPEAERGACTVTLTIEPRLPTALFDEAQLRQAMLNLLRNAREAMPQGGAIDVRAFAQGMSVVLEIADRGGGIPGEIRDRVFDPFFSTKGEGTGLGLAITRHIVEAHGGTLTCAEREGGGTVFRLALPIAPARAR